MEDRWGKLEEIVRRVVREEITALGKKEKLGFVNGRWTGVTEEQMQAWGAAYGNVDIEAELKKAAAWIVSNPMMAPKSQHSRFLNSWLTKIQNQQALRSIPTLRPTATPPSLCAYCLNASVGAVGGRRHCRDHAQNAMDGEAPPKMPGISAKQVAGAD